MLHQVSESAERKLVVHAVADECPECRVGDVDFQNNFGDRCARPCLCGWLRWAAAIRSTVTLPSGNTSQLMLLQLDLKTCVGV